METRSKQPRPAPAPRGNAGTARRGGAAAAAAAPTQPTEEVAWPLPDTLIEIMFSLVAGADVNSAGALLCTRCAALRGATRRGACAALCASFSFAWRAH